MVNSRIGVTDTGFKVATYDEMLDSLQDELMSAYGNDIQLTPNSTIGILSALMAKRLTSCSQSTQQAFYNSFVNTANGTALDRLGSNFDVKRKVATHAIAEVTIRTEEEYLVQAGEQFETEDGIIFNLINDVITEKDPNPPVPPSARDEDTPNDSDESNDNDSDGDDDDTDDPEPVGNYVGVGIVQSDEVGTMNNVLANTITVVSNPDDNIVSVTNLQSAGGGQDGETDEAYRKRIIIENVAKPGSTENGIYSALMNLSGVKQVGFAPNKTGETDEDGNPPYSEHIYVLGGNRQEIAETLYKYVAAGTTLAGDEVVQVTDVNGFKTEIRFSFAKELSIFVKLHVRSNSNWNADSDSDALKQAVADSINELRMGKTVYSTRLYSSIYNFDGVEEALVEVGRSKDDLATNVDIKANRFEIPTCVKSNIEIEYMEN